MRPRMPSGRAHASVGRSCERLRRAARQHGYRRDELIQIIESLP